MLKDLFISKTRVKLFENFLSDPTQMFHVRDLVRKTGDEINAVRRELARMEQVGMVKKEPRGNRLYFWFRKDYVYYRELLSLVAKNTGSRGVLLCGSGIGVEVVANKFDGVRAGIGKNVLQVEAGRRDDDMNVLVIAADFTTEKEAKAMLIAFLETKYVDNARHERRLEEIVRIEENN